MHVNTLNYAVISYPVNECLVNLSIWVVVLRAYALKKWITMSPRCPTRPSVPNVSCETRGSDVNLRFGIRGTCTRMLDENSNSRSQWFLSLRSVASGLEKPLRRLSKDDGDDNENGKKATPLDRQCNNLARESRFCTFLYRRCSTTTWNFLISRFIEDVDTRQRFSFSFCWLRDRFLEFNY